MCLRDREECGVASCVAGNGHWMAVSNVYIRGLTLMRPAGQRVGTKND